MPCSEYTVVVFATGHETRSCGAWGPLPVTYKYDKKFSKNAKIFIFRYVKSNISISFSEYGCLLRSPSPNAFSRGVGLTVGDGHPAISIFFCECGRRHSTRGSNALDLGESTRPVLFSHLSRLLAPLFIAYGRRPSPRARNAFVRGASTTTGTFFKLFYNYFFHTYLDYRHHFSSSTVVVLVPGRETRSCGERAPRPVLGLETCLKSHSPSYLTRFDRAIAI